MWSDSMKELNPYDDTKFKIGDKVTSIYKPFKIGTVTNIRMGVCSEPVYTVEYEDGNEYANYGCVFKKVE